MTDERTTAMGGHDVEDEAHRASCEACATLWAELEQISAEARQLPLLTPSRDLWEGIEARIAAPTLTLRPWYRRQAARQTVRLATAASLLIAATAGITWSIATRDATRDAAGGTVPVAAPDLATAFGEPTPVVGQMQRASLDNTVATMDREITQLEALVRDRRALLDARTVTILQQNLALIDRAIAESRAALDADPASRFLAVQYARAYTSKLTLLRDAVTLPTGI